MDGDRTRARMKRRRNHLVPRPGPFLKWKMHTRNTTYRATKMLGTDRGPGKENDYSESVAYSSPDAYECVVGSFSLSESFHLFSIHIHICCVDVIDRSSIRVCVDRPLLGPSDQIVQSHHGFRSIVTAKWPPNFETDGRR